MGSPGCNLLKIKILVLLIILISVLPVDAHSGRTDYSGGHYDRSTGDYHYHHGYGPHYHNWSKCPYDFIELQGIEGNHANINEKFKLSIFANIYSGIDNVHYTTSDRRIASIKGHTVTFKKSGKVTITATCKWCKDSVKVKVTDRKITLLKWAGFGVICACLFFGIKYREKQKEKEKQIIFLKKYKEEKEYYSSLYGGKSINELACVPSNIKFGDDDLPISIDNSGLKWGEVFTVFITQNGNRFHNKMGCCGAQHPVHLFKIVNRKTGCAKCAKKCRAEIPKWYSEYAKIKNIKDKYNID